MEDGVRDLSREAEQAVRFLPEHQWQPAAPMAQATQEAAMNPQLAQVLFVWPASLAASEPTGSPG
jgi:hypothetical protein